MNKWRTSNLEHGLVQHELRVGIYSLLLSIREIHATISCYNRNDSLDGMLFECNANALKPTAELRDEAVKQMREHFEDEIDHAQSVIEQLAQVKND